MRTRFDRQDPAVELASYRSEDGEHELLCFQQDEHFVLLDQLGNDGHLLGSHDTLHDAKLAALDYADERRDA